MHDATLRPRRPARDRSRPTSWTTRRTAERRAPLSTATRGAAELRPYELRYDVREGYTEHHRVRPV